MSKFRLAKSFVQTKNPKFRTIKGSLFIQNDKFHNNKTYIQQKLLGLEITKASFNSKYQSTEQ